MIEEIQDQFDFIIQEVLRCPLIAQFQRNVYTNKKTRELIEQNELLFEAEFINEVGVTRYQNHTKLVQVCYLIFYIFLNEFQETYQNCKKKKNHEHIELDDFSYVSP